VENPDVAVFTQWSESTAADAQASVGKDGILINAFNFAEAIAFRTGAVVRVEGEIVGLRVGINVGGRVGTAEGSRVGGANRIYDGAFVGFLEGDDDGCFVG
jgi:hypothetical protein